MIVIRKIVLLLVIFTASTANSLVINGNDVVDIYGHEGFVTAYDQSTITTHIGSSVAFLNGRDDSIFNINGGDISWLQLYNNNKTSISFVEDLSWLLVSDDSEITIFGTNFSYSGGHLSGVWSNGLAFSFWALEELDLHSGAIGNIIPDNIILRAVSVPEPSSLTLLIMCLALLTYRKKI